MKNVCLFLILSLFCTQTPYAQQWKIGGKVGVNWSDLNGFIASDQKSKLRIGYHAGFVGNYAFQERLDLQGEILYTFRSYTEKIWIGGEFPANDLPPKSLAKTRALAHYVDVPLTIHVYPFRREACFSLQAGIQPGFSIRETFKNPVIQDPSLPDYYGDPKVFDFGLIFGGAFQFPVEGSQNHFFLDARYVWDLTDHYKNNPSTMRRNSIQLSIGYLFTVR